MKTAIPSISAIAALCSFAACSDEATDEDSADTSTQDQAYAAERLIGEHFAKALIDFNAGSRNAAASKISIASKQLSTLASTQQGTTKYNSEDNSRDLDRIAIIIETDDNPITDEDIQIIFGRVHLDMALSHCGSEGHPPKGNIQQQLAAAADHAENALNLTEIVFKADFENAITEARVSARQLSGDMGRLEKRLKPAFKSLRDHAKAAEIEIAERWAAAIRRIHLTGCTPSKTEHTK